MWPAHRRAQACTNDGQTSRRMRVARNIPPHYAMSIVMASMLRALMPLKDTRQTELGKVVVRFALQPIFRVRSLRKLACQSQRILRNSGCREHVIFRWWWATVLRKCPGQTVNAQKSCEIRPGHSCSCPVQHTIFRWWWSTVLRNGPGDRGNSFWGIWRRHPVIFRGMRLYNPWFSERFTVYVFAATMLPPMG